MHLVGQRIARQQQLAQILGQMLDHGDFGASRQSRIASAKGALARSRPCVRSVRSRITPAAAGLERSAAALHPRRQRPACRPDIDPVDRAIILAAILKVVDDLQRGAQRIVHRPLARSSPCTSSTKRPTGMAE
jgi:hypothetical protein